MTADVRGKGIAEKGDIPGVKNVIAVGSGKGGVGKSTMAASIAYGLQAYGSQVGLMDADVYGPSIPHLVGAKGRPMAMGERIMPIEANGLKLMSMGFLLEPERAVIMRGPMLHGIMQQFLHQVEWGELDYLVIDLPPGTGDVPLTLAQSLPLTGAVVVCTPQEVALIDAVRAVAMFRQLKVPILGMVENMSFFDVQAYLRERGGPNARGTRRPRTRCSRPPATSGSTSSAGAVPAARPNRWASPSSARSRSTSCSARAATTAGSATPSPRLPLPPLSPRRRRATRRPDQHPEHQVAQDAQARNPQLIRDQRSTTPKERLRPCPDPRPRS